MILTSHLIFMALTTGLAAPSLAPQDATAEDESTWTNRVIALRHADPDELAATLQRLDTPARVVRNDLNVVLRGPQASLDELAALITLLDKPGEPSSESRQAVLPLKHAVGREVVSVLENVLFDLRGRTVPGPRMAVDFRNNAIVISGTSDDLRRAEQLIALLDTPAASTGPRPASPFRLEFSFLAATFAGGPKPLGAPLPPALKPVAEALAESGLDHLAMVSPVSVMADPAAEFQQSWPVGVDESTVLNFDLEGQADEREDAVVLRVRAQVRGTRKEGPATLSYTAFAVETNVTTVPNEYVVLAASPSGANLGGAMVLVLRVTRQARP